MPRKNVNTFRDQQELLYQKAIVDVGKPAWLAQTSTIFSAA
jgi:hypothetical protein